MILPASSRARISHAASCVALCYAALLASSVLACLPTVTLLDELGVGRLPGGERALFEPGALLLLEVVRLGWARFARSLASSALVMVLTTLLTLPVTAAVMVRLERPEKTAWRPWLAGAVRSLPTFLMLGGITLLCRAGVLVLIGLSAARYHDVVLVAFGDKPADLALVAAAVVTMLLLGVLGALQDLARAVAVTHSADSYSALQHGLQMAWRRPLRWALPWSAATAFTLAAMLVPAGAVAVFDVSRPGAWTPVAQLLVCQTATVLALTSRIWWFDRALRLARTYARAPIA
jgi:hypothetical protein